MRAPDDTTAIVKRLDALLTRERLRVYPAVVLLTFGMFWILHAFNAPNSLLPDFRARWTAGAMLSRGLSAELYDPVTQSVLQRADGAHALSWFVSPPPVAVLSAPFGAMPYKAAALFWLATSVIGLLLVVGLLRPYWPAVWGPFWPVVLIAAASQPTLELVGAGQDSWLILLSLVGAWRLWLVDRCVLAGLVLALGVIVKPQLMLGAVVLVFVYGGLRMLGAVLLGAVGLSLSSCLVVDASVWLDWIHTVTSPVYTDQVTIGQAYKSASLQGFTIAIAPHGTKESAAGVGLVAGMTLLICWVIWLVRRRPPQWVSLSTAAFVTVLAAPHAMVYDLVILLPAAAVVLQRSASMNMRVTAAAGFILAFVGPLLSFSRTIPWPVSILAAQWLVPVTAFILVWLMIQECPLEPKRHSPSIQLVGPEQPTQGELRRE